MDGDGLESRLRRIEEKLLELSIILERVEKYLSIKRSPFGDLPQFPDRPWSDPLEANLSTTCRTCGLDLNQVLGYVCPRPDCPVGLCGAQFSLNLNHSDQT